MNMLKKLCTVATSVAATMLICGGLAVLIQQSVDRPENTRMGFSRARAASVYADCISSVDKDSPLYKDMDVSCRTVSVKLSACQVDVGSDCTTTTVGDK